MEQNKGKNELLLKSELSIWLDTYDDIFSDFDTRDYVDRALSDDFIREARKMAREKSSGDIQLTLLIPGDLRDTAQEEIIINSLHKHFLYFAVQIKNETKSISKRGYMLCLAGFALMILAAYLMTWSTNITFNILKVMMEPSGWFLAWTGFEQIFYTPRKRYPDYNFNHKMSQAEIVFLSL